MLVRGVAKAFLEEDQVDVIGFSAEESGEGNALIIQFPRQLEDEDDGYHLSTDMGATYFGGIDDVAIDLAKGVVSITLTADAAETLGLVRQLEFQVERMPEAVVDVLGCFEALARHEGIKVVKVSEAS